VNSYITILTPKSTDSSPPGWFIRLLQSVLPAANPDLERYYDDVVTWHVEIEEGTGQPLREVGLDEQQRVLVIGPWRNNHGFIVDCCRTFVPTEYPQISQEQFEHEWQSFDSQAVA
jgi:hypothetical protein